MYMYIQYILYSVVYLEQPDDRNTIGDETVTSDYVCVCVCVIPGDWHL